MSALSGIAKLRAALWQMEKDLGLEDLNRNERDLLYAFHAIAAQGDGTTDISSDQVRRATAVEEMKHATFHRAMKRLIELGYIEHSPNHKTKVYRLGANAQSL
ncbi:hypothetical protein [Salipiger bermudensis]|nr:hypothetical protein [Salipiger bermudensis]MBN9677310.1 MarR family transcriptional regulator [Salipiger bermudensis]MBR9893055.1 MarR family transcriptional regulator [bacterium]MCA1287632.1 MarR family transcriptional regulator [Salipiger bermudensis]